jgi:type IVB pilus formation R64 PilN family outer membrane protein
MMNKKILAAAAVALANLLGGCSTQALIDNSVKATTERSDDASAKVAAAAQKAKQLTADAADSEVDMPYIAGAPVPLGREVTLPAALRKGVKTEVLFKGSDKVDLMEAAAQLTLATGIPVRVRPDALLPQAEFMPKGAQATGQAGPSGAAGGAQPVSVNLKVSEAPAADILNYIATQTGCYWEYKPDQGVIDIFRLVTKTFEFRGLSGSGQVSIGLGRMGGGSSSSSTFESNASTKYDQKDIDAIKNLRMAIEAMMTKGGSGSITDGGTIVVTDTKDSVDSIEKYLKVENRRMNRRVRLVFEAIDVAATDTGERGIDWSLIYEKITQKLTGNLIGTLDLTSPQSVTSGLGGTIGYGVAGNSAFNGSKAILDALHQVGTVVNVTSVPVLTLNRQPVQFAVRNTFDYVQSIQVNTVASSAGTTTAPQIQQKEETVGTSLTITPAAFDDGEIVLGIAYDNTALRSLLPYTAGANSSTTNTVQQRNIDGTGTVQKVPMRSGQTLFISGIERRNESVSKARLDESLPLLAGGSDQAKKSKNTTIILVTAVAEDGV